MSRDIAPSDKTADAKKKKRGRRQDGSQEEAPEGETLDGLLTSAARACGEHHGRGKSSDMLQRLTKEDDGKK